MSGGRKGSGPSSSLIAISAVSSARTAHFSRGRGKEIQDESLADMMLHLQKIGCHNINLVTPTHVMPNIINATRIALKKGLYLPWFTIQAATSV